MDASSPCRLQRSDSGGVSLAASRSPFTDLSNSSDFVEALLETAADGGDDDISMPSCFSSITSPPETGSDDEFGSFELEQDHPSQKKVSHLVDRTDELKEHVQARHDNEEEAEDANNHNDEAQKSNEEDELRQGEKIKKKCRVRDLVLCSDSCCGSRLCNEYRQFILDKAHPKILRA